IPFFRPSSSTASLVIEAVTTALPILMRTCAVVCPFTTSSIVPFNTFRALIRIGVFLLPLRRGDYPVRALLQSQPHERAGVELAPRLWGTLRQLVVLFEQVRGADGHRGVVVEPILGVQIQQRKGA